MTVRRKLVDAREPSGLSADDPVWIRLREIVRILNDSAVLTGRLLDTEDGKPSGSGLIFLGGDTRTFPHKLGREPVGWLEVYLPDVSSLGHVGLFAVDQPSGCTSKHFITVKSTNAGRCAIWVF